MRFHFCSSALAALALAVFPTGPVRADSKAVPDLTLPDIGTAAGDAHPAGQTAFVLAWLRDRAPDYPEKEAPAVAAAFLDDLALHHPAAAEKIGTPDFHQAEYESGLLRVAASCLPAGPSAVREELAKRRVQTALAAEGKDGDAAAMLAKIKDASANAYRRLLEGRLDDDDLVVQFRAVRSARVERVSSVAAGPAKPKELSAGEIVSEFARHNQSGAALEKLRAYIVEADLHSTGSDDQHLVLFKLRPNRFRLVIQIRGLSVMAMGFDGVHFWRQVAGKPGEELSDAEVGPLRYLCEFIDPLLEGEGMTFARREDTIEAGRKCYCLEVKRPDGSGYVAWIDSENFHEIGREEPDGTRSRYSDFHDFSGVTVSHHEETVVPDGKSRSLSVTRMTANPGLIDVFFERPAKMELDLFAVERLLAAATTASATTKTP